MQLYHTMTNSNMDHPASCILVSAALHLQVRWAGFSLKQRAWLNITNQRRAYEEQPLLLYTLASNSGVLPAGAQLQLPAFASGGVDRCLQDGPCGLLFPPAIVLCSARGSTSKPNPASALAGLTAADGCGSLPRGFQLLEYASHDLASCSLEDVCLLLEEGLLDASSLDQAAADALLHRCAFDPRRDCSWQSLLPSLLPRSARARVRA